jgi:lipoprotein-anchoring transpeptidase ErfK/SrfK
MPGSGTSCAYPGTMGVAAAAWSGIRSRAPSRVDSTQDPAAARPGALQVKAFASNPLLAKIASGANEPTGEPMALAKRARPPLPAHPPEPTDPAEKAAYKALEDAGSAAEYKSAQGLINALPEDRRSALNQKLEYEIGNNVDHATTPKQLKDVQDQVNLLPATQKTIWQGVLNDRPKQIQVEKANEIAQTFLFSRGKELLPNGPYLQRKDVDGRFGPGTEKALTAYQKASGLPETGKVDAATLQKMDADAKAQFDRLKALPRSQAAAKIVVDIADKTNTRMILLDKDGQVLAKYRASPGSDKFPTQGTNLKTSDAMVRTPWNNGGAAWSKNMPASIPPGPNNPMGLLKFPIDNNGQYIHDIPGREEAELGHVASHGCVRLGSAIYEAREKYGLRGGLPVTIVRTPEERGTALAGATRWAAGGGPNDAPTDAGREYLFGYLSGELGGPPARR